MSDMLKCEYCGNEFKKIRKTARFCSQECNSKQWYIDYKARGYVAKNPKTTKPKKREKREAEIVSCVICGNEFRKQRKDKITCSRPCANRHWYLKKLGVIRETRVTQTTLIGEEMAKEIEPYLLNWKRRRFMLNEIDLFKAIDLWDKIRPNKYIPDVVDREQLFEEIITDLILHYKRYKSNKHDN